MKPTVLVTDSMFIFPEHEARLREAGFEVERLDKTEATEDELIAALQGKAGYILGGVEHVTERILNSADGLKVIAFTGSDFARHIDYEAAAAKGIKVTNAPGMVTFAVAEMTIAMILMMQRRFFELAPPGDKTFMTVPSLADVRVGIVGMGRIGERVTRLLLALGVGGVTYWNRHRKTELESELGITYASLEELFAACDVISNHMSSQAGTLLTSDLLNRTKEGVLIVNAGNTAGYDLDALYERITKHGARSAFDVDGGVKEERFLRLSPAQWWCTNANAGFNTKLTLQTGSDMATQSVINVLTSGDDTHIVNKS